MLTRLCDIYISKHFTVCAHTLRMLHPQQYSQMKVNVVALVAVDAGRF